ncbi:disease resistance protein RPM1-like isoform X2 [Panicum hallii]|uniref:disease resistance protein RPM1-like isoform X2 n=1 Tax=Panicum hallii TaxID=206008 RepID=UPI000DF4CE21|nr:disease resistance protein RPM1-like isoform X2 [Panicum hallii]
MATLPTRRAISSELHTLKAGVIDLTEQRRRHKIDVTLPAKAKHGDVVDPRLSALNQDIDRLVGLARPMEEVTKMVTESGDKSELKTVSIVGMAGSGKTTLAYAVYMRLREENCFQCHAFVSVGQNLEVKKTLMDMLSMLADGPRVRLDVDIKKVHLIGRLREILEKKRYLIVVDDLWTEECWQIIKCCFPENSLGSRIITTTRKAAMAAECSSSSSDCIYNIGLLSEVDSKKLAFDSWERLNGSNWFSLSHPGGEVMKRIFNLSYNDLPPHLSTCLLHLSIFPQNYEVEIDRLVRRWIAELYIVGARDRDVVNS